MKRLILFDIDETMISSDGAGRRAIGRVLAERFNVPKEAANIPMSGKTDPQILTEILAVAGWSDSDIEKRMGELLDIYLSILEDEIAASRYYIIHPGVVELLNDLHARQDTYLGLLTGNVERGARMKLSRFELNHFFPMGAYGSDSANRMDLPAIAARRAHKHFNIEFVPAEIVIIGDAINDVLCAKGYGAKSIAVNTGRTSWEDLERHQPDYLFKNLGDTNIVVQAIFS